MTRRVKESFLMRADKEYRAIDGSPVKVQLNRFESEQSEVLRLCEQSGIRVDGLCAEF
jgi:hypothetical protein